MLTALRRVAVPGLLLGCVAAGACTTLRRVSPVEFFAKNSPEVVWVTNTDKTVVPVAQPEIVRDTLRGVWLGTARPVAIPLDQGTRVRARVADRKKTAALMATLGVAGVSAVYFLWISKAGPTPNGVGCGFDQRGFPIAYC